MVRIHFFDIDSKLPGSARSWSPNTLKVRTVLNYKGIPYHESFLSYPDIRPFADHFNIPYDASWDPPRPTFPAILHYDDNGHLIKAMSESVDIARYLDKLYPDKPVINPPPSDPWFNAIETYYTAFRPHFGNVAVLCRNIVMPTIPPILDDRGAIFFIEDRSKWRGGVSPLNWGSKKSEDDWKPFLEALQGFMKFVGHISQESPFLLGTQPCYVDFALATFLTWFKRGSEANFVRIISAAPVLGEHYRRCEKWIEGQGKIVEWDGLEHTSRSKQV